MRNHPSTNRAATYLQLGGFVICYRLAALILLAVLPLMNVLAAPAPDPSGILDIGPPPKGETAEQYRKRMMEAQTGPFDLCMWGSDPEVEKLPSVARFKDPRPWLAKNLRVTEEDDRRLRFTFRGGKRYEQATLINALLRVNIARAEYAINVFEGGIRDYEKGIRENELRIKYSEDPKEVEILQQGIHNGRNVLIPAGRARIARFKQIKVIKWAK